MSRRDQRYRIRTAAASDQHAFARPEDAAALDRALDRRARSERLSPAARVGRDFALDVAFARPRRAYPKASSARETELDLGDAAREVEAQRHDRQPLLGDAGLQSRDLLFVKQQLARPRGSMFEKLPCL